MAVVLENFTATESGPETHAEYTPPSVATLFGTPKLTASPSTAPVATSKIIWLPPAAVEPKFKLAALEIALTKVPDNGKVTFVAPLDVSVIEFAPDVANVLPFAKVNVAEVPGAVIVTLFTEVAEATPRVGVVNTGEVSVLLAKVSVPAKVASVPPAAGKIAVPEAVPPALRIVLPLVEP